MIATNVTATREHYVWGTRRREEHAMNSRSGEICEYQLITCTPNRCTGNLLILQFGKTNVIHFIKKTIPVSTFLCLRQMSVYLEVDLADEILDGTCI